MKNKQENILLYPQYFLFLHVSYLKLCKAV